MQGKIIEIQDYLGFIEYDIDKRISFSIDNDKYDIGDIVEFEITHTSIQGSDRFYEQAIIIEKKLSLGDRSLRLSKASRELNVSLSMIVDILSKRGFEVIRKPNTKITEQQFQIVKEYIKTEMKMFDVFKQDVKVGDVVKLYLTTGNEPEGKVLEIGVNYVIINTEENVSIRFFDKLIGGWNIQSIDISLIIKDDKKKYSFPKAARVLEDNLVPSGLDAFINKEIENEDENLPVTDSELWKKFSTLTNYKVRRNIIVKARKRLGYFDPEERKSFKLQKEKSADSTISIGEFNNEIKSSGKFQTFEELQNAIIEDQLNQFISPNAEIDRYFVNYSNGSANNQEVSEIRFKNDVVYDNDLINELKSFDFKNSIPIICTYNEKVNKPYAYFVHKPATVRELIKKIEDLLLSDEGLAASNLLRILRNNKIDVPILSDLQDRIAKKLKQNLDTIKVDTPFTEPKQMVDINLDDVNMLLGKARKLRLKKQFVESERLYLLVIDKNHQIDTAVKDLADQYREQGRLNEAISLVEKHFQSFEKKEQGYNFLYDLYISNGDLKKAMHTLENYVSTAFDKNNRVLKRRRGKAYARLGALAHKTNELDSAKIYFEKSEGLYPDNKLLKGVFKQIYLDKSEIITKSKDDFFDENLFNNLVYGISPFLKYALENCNYDGIPLLVKEKKIYNQKTLDNLRELIETSERGRPEVRAKYYLTEARILQDLERADDKEFNKALAKYCNAMAKIVAADKGPIETIRDYYLNAFNVEDDWASIGTQVSIFFESFYKNHAIIASSRGVGLEKAILSITPAIYSKEFFWDFLLELFINSKQATAKVLAIIFRNEKLKDASLLFLKEKLLNRFPESSISKNKYIELWKESTRQRKIEREKVEGDLRSYLKIDNLEELTDVFLSKGKVNIPSFINELGKTRIDLIVSMCENVEQYINQQLFDEKEFYFNTIDASYNELKNSIDQYPTGFSINSILPLSTHLLNLIHQKHQESILVAKPQITIAIEGECIIDENSNCEVQISISNSPQSSKVSEIEINMIRFEEGIESINTPDKFNQILRGGTEPFIAKFILKLNEEIILQGATDVKIQCDYKELATSEMQSIEENLSVIFYNSSDYKEISNPYAEHAKSNIVENPKMFKGRSDLINRISDTIISSKSKGYLIYGQKRSGKSSVLWHLENKLNESEKAFAIYFSTGLSIAQDGNVEANLYYIILSKIEIKLRKLKSKGVKVPDIGKTIREELLTNPMIVFYDRLYEIEEAFLLLDEWKHKKLVLIIDEFTYIYYQIKLGNISPTFMQNWKAFVEDGGFSVILSGQDTMMNFVNDYQNEFAMFKTERLTYLEDAAARELIEEPIWDNDNNKSRLTRNSVDKIVDLTACNPFYIQIVCNELVKFMNIKKKPVLTPFDIEHVIKRLTIGLNSLIEFDFENLLSAGDPNLDEIKPQEAKNILRNISNLTKYIPYCRREDIIVFGTEQDEKILKDLHRREVISTQSENYNKYKIQVQLFKQWLLNHN